AGSSLLTVAGSSLLTVAGSSLLTVAGKSLLTVAGRLLLTVAGAMMMLTLPVCLSAGAAPDYLQRNGSAEAQRPEAISVGETLSLERCIEIAIKNQPNIIAAAYTVMANESRIAQAASGYYPQVGLSAAYSRYAPVSGVGGSSSAGSYNQLTNNASVTQNIYDFGRVKTQVDIQRLTTDASSSDLKTAREQVVYNVKQAYYTLLQTIKNLEVAKETVEQFQQHLQQAVGFYQVGEKAKFDVTKAEVDLSNARLNLIKAENALRLARVNLNNAMGLPYAIDYLIEDNLAFQEYGVTLNDMIEKAFKNRADIQAIIAKEKAAQQTIELRKKDYYPTVSGSATYTWAGESFPLNSGWNVGAQVSLSVFSGYLTKNQIQEAEFNLKVLRANEDTLRQSIIVDVQQYYLQLMSAQETISAANMTVEQAKENLDIANGRYGAGLGSPIDVTDANITYSNAKTAYIQALTDYKTAQASLEKAMGETR
ncbi:MAG: TolC family protein, partial [Nitrospirae bacterium]|nr:TolC family protein [Nitrospirota bacterium]